MNYFGGSIYVQGNGRTSKKSPAGSEFRL